jgi:ABC-type lipoprotein release transport system permease subunit
MPQAYRQGVREKLLLALDTLRTHKFRSFLTVLGVLIGTTTVIAVTSIIAGLDKQLVDVAEQFGTRTLWVYKLQHGAPHALTREERLRRPLSYEDAMAIKEQSASTATVSVELFREMGDFGLPPVTARYKGQNMHDALFVGVTAHHLRLMNTTLGEGRFFTETDDLHRRVKPADPDNFGISSAESVISQFRQLIGTVGLVMVVISSIGLLVGGIGVMNIMLVSVTERTREIGLRKAIGARRRDITWQFLPEAMTLTASGGLIGILVGWLLSVAIRTFVPSLPSTVPL